MDNPQDIIIVGGGMVGLTLACDLAAFTPLNIVVVESGGEPSAFELDTFDSRVVALSRASQGYFSSLGVWPRIEQLRACPYYAMSVWDGEGCGGVTFNCADSHEPNLGHIVENSVVVRALREKIARDPQITFLENTVLDDIEPGRVVLLQNGKRRAMAAPIIVAADGARSTIRQKMGFATREWDYGQSAIVCTVQTEKRHDFTCRQRFTESGPIALLPLCEKPYTYTGSAFHSSLVWSIDEARCSSIMALDENAFCKQLGIELEHVLGAVQCASERHRYSLRQRHAKDYVQPGVALIGDAAHTIHPLAGQGVNLGLADAQALALEIRRACEREISLSHFSILQRYQRQRKAQNLATMAAMEGFKQLFGSDDIALRWLRNTGMTFFDRQHALKKVVMNVAAGQQ